MKSAFAEHLVSTGRLSREQLNSVSADEWREHEPIGRLAMMHGLLDGSQIDEILRRQCNQEKLFGEIAIELGILTREQLEILVRGQALRACVELVEDLALGGGLDIVTGIEAIKEFVNGESFRHVLSGAEANLNH